MMKKVSGLGLGLLCALAQPGFASAPSARADYKEWRSILAQTETDTPSAEMLRILTKFVAQYPKGRHVSDARFAIAEVLYKEERYQEALPHYEFLVERKDPGFFADALLRIGEIHYNSKRFKEASKTWDILADKISSNSMLLAEAWYGQALCELRDKNFVKANKVMDRLVRKFPAYKDLPKVREILGILRFHEKNFNEAWDLLEGMATPTAAFYRGMSYFHQKQFLEAANSFKELETMSSGAYGEIAAYFKAECFRMAQNEALATQAYGQFLERYPNSRLQVYALIQMSSFLHRLGRQKEAAAALKKVWDNKPSLEIQAYALFMEGQIAAKDDDHAKALRIFGAALKKIKASGSDLADNIKMAQAASYIKLNRWADAATTMQDMIKKRPYHPVGIAAHMISGQEALLRGDWPRAISSYERAILQYQYSSMTDVAMTMMLTAYFKAHKYQELVTNSNRVLQVLDSGFTVQELLWRSHSHYLLGESYYRLKMYPEASRHYIEALKSPQAPLQPRLYLAWSRFHEGKFSDAVKSAQQVLDADAQLEEYKASAHFLMAGSYFNQGKFNEAIEGFQSFRKRFGDDVHVPESWLQEGWAQRQSGFPGDALVAWQRLSSKFPGSPLAQEAMIQVGQLYFQGRKYKQAAKAFADFLVKCPNSPFTSEAQWFLAQSYYNAEDFEEAIQQYEIFAAKYPADHKVADARNLIMVANYRNASQSNDIKLLARFVRLYPQSTQAPEAQYQLARLLFEKKDWSNASAQFRKLVLDYPGTSQAPAALLAVAQAEEFLKRPEEAVREYESLLRLFPANALALEAAMRLGAIYFYGDKFKEAAKSFQFVVERDAAPQVRADALYNLAVCYKKARQLDDALKAFERFAQSFDSDSRMVDALTEIASIHLAMENQLKAIETFMKVLEMKQIPSLRRIEICAQVGDLYKNMGDKGRAVEFLDPLMTLSPANADARLLGLAQLAALYEEQEAWEKALAVYNQIARSNGKKAWVRAAAKRHKEIKAYVQASRLQARQGKADATVKK